MADVLLDSYLALWQYARQVQAVHPSSSGYDSATGHCFHHTKANNHKIKKVYLHLKRAGTINGTVRVDLFAITGTCGSTGKPTGNALASSGVIATSSIGTVRYVKTLFTFAVGQQYELVPNVKYVVALIGVSGTYGASQYIMVKFSGTGGIDDGNDCFYDYYYPTWGYFLSGDLYFEVWGEEVAPPPTEKPLIDKPLVSPVLVNPPMARILDDFNLFRNFSRLTRALSRDKFTTRLCVCQILE